MDELVDKNLVDKLFAIYPIDKKKQQTSRQIQLEKWMTVISWIALVVLVLIVVMLLMAHWNPMSQSLGQYLILFYVLLVCFIFVLWFGISIYAIQDSLFNHTKNATINDRAEYLHDQACIDSIKDISVVDLENIKEWLILKIDKEDNVINRFLKNKDELTFFGILSGVQLVVERIVNPANGGYSYYVSIGLACLGFLISIYGFIKLNKMYLIKYRIGVINMAIKQK